MLYTAATRLQGICCSCRTWQIPSTSLTSRRKFCITAHLCVAGFAPSRTSSCLRRTLPSWRSLPAHDSRSFSLRASQVVVLTSATLSKRSRSVVAWCRTTCTLTLSSSRLSILCVLCCSSCRTWRTMPSTLSGGLLQFRKLSDVSWTTSSAKFSTDLPRIFVTTLCPHRNFSLRESGEMQRRQSKGCQFGVCCGIPTRHADSFAVRFRWRACVRILFLRTRTTIRSRWSRSQPGSSSRRRTYMQSFRR
mmetsp:Transcript_38107/g.94733  ORF Transcript_38107/g.94733 Transcript_38107/m.94733 type:complete len:248 (-) Transcript_38107:861-1604(-)